MRCRRAWILALVLAACGGGEDGVSLDELGQELAVSTCERAFSCCETSELEAQLGIFYAETEAECTAQLSGLANQLLVPQLEDGVESGRIIYHADRMSDCLSLIRSLDCGEALEESSSALAIACDDAFEGQVANGDACATDEECESGTCIGDSMDLEGNVTEGECGDAPAVGSACTEDFECAEGAWCDSSGSDPICATPQSAGAECFSGDECESGHCSDSDAGDSEPGSCASEPLCDGT